MKSIQKERIDKILNLLKEKQYLKYSELEKKFDVSPITVRRDINKMESLGLVNKILGGIESKKVNQDIDYDIRSKKNLGIKKSIAKKASIYLKNNTLIFLDSGTTVYEIIPYLKNRNITVVTNSVKHIDRLVENDIEFIILGGKVKKITKAIVGASTLEQIENFNFDICFIGANGVDEEKGFTTPDIEEAYIKKLAIKKSKKVLILSDESKFNKISNIKFKDFSWEEWIR